MTRPLRQTPLREEVRLRLEEIFPRIAPLVPEPTPTPVVEPESESTTEPDDVVEPTEVAPPARGLMRGVNRTHVKYVAVGGGLVVVVALWWALSGRAEPLPLPAPVSAGSASASPKSTLPASPGAVTTGGAVVVHVAGAVNNPGVVMLPPGSRVGQAVVAAGGFAPNALAQHINLAAPLSDGVQIYVRAVGEADVVPPPGPGSGTGPVAPLGTAGSTSKSGGPVDLNTATADQLDELPGVGPATVQKILAWRQQHGRFSRVEELREVDGIGEKTFARLKELVRV